MRPACAGRSGHRPRCAGHRGFTLLELLVAVALMAVLAILCYRGLDAVLRSRDRVDAASDEIRALNVAFSQMQDDLRHSWPIRLMQIRARDPISFSSQEAGGPVALELLRETDGFDERLRLQRVVYRLRGTQLERGFGPWLVSSADANAVVTESSMTWQPLLSDVVGLEFRAFIEEQGQWVSAASLVGSPSVVARLQASGAAGAQANAAAATALGTVPGAVVGRTITGVEVQLARRGGGRIVRIFAVKD